MLKNEFRVHSEHDFSFHAVKNSSEFFKNAILQTPTCFPSLEVHKIQRKKRLEWRSVRVFFTFIPTDFSAPKTFFIFVPGGILPPY